MRKLLVKLVAFETAILGWLSYWLFLVYANNPTVSQDLANQLDRFPQISYTTIDISIIVIIAVFSILLAIRFDRGLRPGMKLERALQMLENLMKRNLFLEAQLAEIRVDKSFGKSSPHDSALIVESRVPPSTSTAPILPATNTNPQLLPPQRKDTFESSSWENAFRIPIEAGPTIAKINAPTTPSTSNKFTGPRVASDSQLPSDFSKSPLSSSGPDHKEERPQIRPGVNAQEWEDSPRRTLETRGIISASQTPPHKPAPSVPPSTTLSSRLPYIPMPPPKTPPASVITGPTASTNPVTKAYTSPTSSTVPKAPSSPQLLKQGLPAQARPISKATSPGSAGSSAKVGPIPLKGSGSPGPVVSPLFQTNKSPPPVLASKPLPIPTQNPPATPEQKADPKAETESNRDVEEDDRIEVNADDKADEDAEGPPVDKADDEDIDSED